ncbi:MAG: flagellar export chaperone FliS [Chloroflexota bacterium]
MAVAFSQGIAQLNSYRTQSVLCLSSGELVLKAYDIALTSLSAQDGDKACKVIAHLIDSLDFQYEEVSAGLFRLYRYCLEEIKKGELEVPTRILRELRDSWSQALRQHHEPS